MRVTVNQDLCCSSGLCSQTVPAVFDQSEDDGVVLLLDATPPEELHAEVREAAAVCPSQAITVD